MKDDVKKIINEIIEVCEKTDRDPMVEFGRLLSWVKPPEGVNKQNLLVLNGFSADVVGFVERNKTDYIKFINRVVRILKETGLSVSTIISDTDTLTPQQLKQITLTYESTKGNDIIYIEVDRQTLQLVRSKEEWFKEQLSYATILYRFKMKRIFSDASIRNLLKKGGR
nr:MAG TPA: hypothetical protein [Myoviridae sp. ctNPX13]